MTTDVLSAGPHGMCSGHRTATYVHIDYERLSAYAATLHRGDRSPKIRGVNASGSDEAAAAFVITLDAINFGSGYFPYLRKRDGMSGYHTVATALR